MKFIVSYDNGWRLLNLCTVTGWAVWMPHRKRFSGKSEYEGVYEVTIQTTAGEIVIGQQYESPEQAADITNGINNIIRKFMFSKEEVLSMKTE